MAKKDYIEHYPVIGDKVGQQTNRIYAAKVESMDESIGRVLKKLADLKLDEKTIVIFTSDNGGLSVIEGPNTPATMNAPLREGKGYLYEGGMRVSLLIKWPGVIKPGSTSATPVSSYDFFPTILEACGARSDAKVDGVSLVPALKGGSLKPRPLYWHYPHYSNQGGMPGAVIRDGDWKLIEFYEHGRWELFSMTNDSREMKNLATAEPAIARRLAKKLDDWPHRGGALR
ncbi:MAG: sulfatase-like hydrolase/transferase [Rhodobacteraceae bacterium]|nr:sulfatase-like hydrolase/transferase [Paracoccaceae bacterium]